MLSELPTSTSLSPQPLIFHTFWGRTFRNHWFSFTWNQSKFSVFDIHVYDIGIDRVDSKLDKICPCECDTDP